MGSLRRTERQFTVSFHGKSGEGHLDGGGKWLEQVAAGAFLAAGAEEVLIGVEWAWPAGREPKGIANSYKDEADVIARFGPTIFAISCKAGKSESLAVAAREVEAKAFRLVTRFAIPILVRPQFQPEDVRGRLLLKQGAVYLGLRELFSDELPATLSTIRQARSKLAD